MSDMVDGFAGWRLGTAAHDVSRLEVLAEVDVVVTGGGAAGVAAATVCAENGLSVVLIERYGFCGGAAVAGMSGTICGLYLAADDGEPQQIVHGFTERFRQALAAGAGVTGPQRYGRTWTVAHDPLVWREVADDLLEGAGVRILLHTVVSGVLVEDGRHTGVIVESNAGRAVVRAARTIDASGDAAVVARAGHATRFGDDGRIQNPTMFFRLGNVDLDHFHETYGSDTICPPWVSSAIESAREEGLDLPRSHIWLFDTTRPAELLVNATRLVGRDGRMLNVIDPEDFTEAEIEGRRQVRAYARFLRERVPGCAEAFVIDTGVEVGIRQTRSIEAVETLTNDDVLACRKREDGIVRSAWPIELHAGARPELHWLIGDYYEVPYLSLVPRTGENIVVAGRCLGAQHAALASARVTAQCFEYGHAAAAATVLSLREDKPYRSIAGREVRAAMRTAGSSI
ncbi:FAD-dependent oxidoreductase [Amycolatopsis jiangsuensis]|uniref:FAD dependent oxidoreductase n=1 Tax=Amycolatopsis jiangsuensis TaxID=1181879 RepID=A0A840IZC4_9PSEU|nr:FAD-dependent oxidoreductase [Amycolatopsis jiangsuensis]MBB4686765.1 hypothetical protein [Amycolatopsis jiangsuensis]